MPGDLVKKKKTKKTVRREETLKKAATRIIKKFTKDIKEEGKKRGKDLDVYVMIEESESQS